MPNNTVVFLLACHFTCWSFADEKWGFKRQSQQFTNKRSTRVALKPPNKVWKKKTHLVKNRMWRTTSKTQDVCHPHHQKSGFLPSKTGFQPANEPIPPATGNAGASKAIGTSFIASKAWRMEKCLWISLMYQDSLISSNPRTSHGSL